MLYLTDTPAHTQQVPIVLHHLVDNPRMSVINEDIYVHKYNEGLFIQ